MQNENPPASGIVAFFKKLSKGVGGKIAMGVLCTAIVGAIKDAPAIWKGLRWVCAGIGKLGDQDASKKIDELLNKGKEVVNNPPVVAPSVNPAPEAAPEQPKTIIGRIKDNAHKAAASGKEAVGNAVEKGKEKGDEVIATAKGEANKVVDAIKQNQPNASQYAAAPPQGSALPPIPPLPRGGTPHALPGHPRDVGQQVSGLVQDLANTATGAMNTNPITRQIQDRNDALKKRQGELAPLKEIYAIWWSENGPNAGCPKCRIPMSVSRAGNGAAACPKCRVRGKASQFRVFAPPMPPEPPAPFYAWKAKRDEALAKQEKKQAEAKKQEKPEPAKEKKP